MMHKGAVYFVLLCGIMFSVGTADSAPKVPTKIPATTSTPTSSTTATATPTAAATPAVPNVVANVLNDPPPAPDLKTGLLLEDFSHAQLDQFPTDWHPKGENGRRFYTVAQAGGRKYLKVDAVLDGTSVFRELKWDVKKYPVLEWCWRGRLLPKNGYEKRQSTNDVTVGLYVVYPIRTFIPDTLKYNWSTTLPVGTEFYNGFAGKNKIHVVESGDVNLGKWVIERRNVLEEYKRRFDREPSNPLGIGVITDADNTKSASSGDYAYFKALTLEEAAALPMSK